MTLPHEPTHVERRVSALERAHYELDAKIDAAFPGADLRQHYAFHEKQIADKINSGRTMDRVIGWVVQVVLWAAVFAAAWVYLKIGGPK